MTVADGSQVRLAYVAESVIGTINSTPSFKTQRYVNSDVRLVKTTDINNEVRGDRNVPGITDVGRMVQGTINCLHSADTFDDWLSYLLCKAWAPGGILKNGITPFAVTLEQFYEQGTTDTFVRYRGCRINTLEMNLRPRASVSTAWGFMGIGSPTPENAIISGATYAAATTTEVFNAGLNVAALDFTGIANAPKIQALTMRVTNNIYPVDVVGQYDVYAHGLGRFEVSGTMTCLFENLDTYQAIVDHDTVNVGFTLTDAASNSQNWNLSSVKLLDGGPNGPGNNAPAILEVPFMAFYDPSDLAAIVITRTPAS